MFNLPQGGGKFSFSSPAPGRASWVSWPLGQNLPTCLASPRGGDRAGVHNIQDIFMKFLTHNSEGLFNVSCKHHINITRFGFTANFTACAGIKKSVTFYISQCDMQNRPKRYRCWKSQNWLLLHFTLRHAKMSKTLSALEAAKLPVSLHCYRCY